MGETASVAPLIRALLEEGHAIHLSVVTDTGFAHARKLFGNQISIAYLPWDLPGLMARMAARIRPRILLLTETEFWPGMLNACRRRNIPVIGINTRISDRSYPRYLATRPLWKRWLRGVALFLAQSELDAERLADIGVEKTRIRMPGHLKYAIRPPRVDSDAIRRRIDPSAERPLLLAASTHEDEEARLCRMLPGWRELNPDVVLVLVPRHPQRFDAVAQTIADSGLSLRRWSESENNTQANNAPDVVLVDAMGVLAGLYSVADVVVMGGSLIPHGGQNPLEAAVCGRGVITGPHMHNFRAIMQEMRKAGAAVHCDNAEEVDGAVRRFLKHPHELRELHARSAAFMQDKGKVLERVLEHLRPWLDQG